MSGIGLIASAPIFFLITIVIIIDNKGPVLFFQRRMGRNFKPFTLYKFRTMVENAAQEGLLITVGGDPRITRIGKYLRRTKLDELPQLINVIKGDMSLVGPRPEIEEYVRLYDSDYKEILKFRPGVTDLASLNYINEENLLKGKEDPEIFYINFLLSEKIRLAKEYMKISSFSNDLKIILLTFYNIIRCFCTRNY